MGWTRTDKQWEDWFARSEDKRLSKLEKKRIKKANREARKRGK